MNSSSEADEELTQPFSPSFEADQSHNKSYNDQLDSDEDIFSMSTQPLEQSCNYSNVDDSETQIISQVFSIDDGIPAVNVPKQRTTENVGTSNESAICDMETQPFDLDSNAKVLINCVSKKKPPPYHHRSSSHKSHSANLYVESSESDDDILDRSDLSIKRTSNKSRLKFLVHETPVHKAKRTRNLSQASTEEDADATQKIDGFEFKESEKSPDFNTSPFDEAETPTNSTSINKNEDVDGNSTFFSSPILLEMSQGDVGFLRPQSTTVNIYEAETQLISSSQLPQAPNRMKENREYEVEEAETQPMFGTSPDQVFDITEAETQLFASSPTKLLSLKLPNRKISENSRMSSSVTHPNMSCASEKTLSMAGASENSSHNYPPTREPDQTQKSVSGNLENSSNNYPTTPKLNELFTEVLQDEDSNDTYPQTQKLEFFAKSPENEDSSDIYPQTQKLVVEDEDSSDNYPQTQKLVVRNESDEDSSDDYPQTQKLVVEDEDSNDNYPQTQKLVVRNESDEDSSDNYPQTQKLAVQGEDSNDHYPQTQKLSIKNDEDSSDNYPQTQKLTIAGEDSNDLYPQTQKLVIENENDEDSSDSYPQTQKSIIAEPGDSNNRYPQTPNLLIENESDEDSLDNYPQTQKLIIAGSEDSNENYPPTQKLDNLPTKLPQDEDSSDNYLETQKLLDLTLPESPVLGLGHSSQSNSFHSQVASLKELCQRQIKSNHQEIQLKFPMLCQSRNNKQLDSSAMDIATPEDNQLIFVVAENELDTSSMDIETQTFSPVFTLKSEKSENDTFIDDGIDDLLRCSTPVPDEDDNKLPHTRVSGFLIFIVLIHLQTFLIT